MFRLHLRTEQQARQSTIYGKCFKQEEIKELITDFKKRAQHALFFIPIKMIKASYPGPRHPESWTVEKSTEDPHSFSGIMGIHHRQPPLQPKLAKWSVLFKTIPLQDIPSDFHESLTVHKIQTVSIGIAGALGTPPSKHRPFSGLPLLDTISLPIHLHCTFILSDDRRSRRYDEKGTGNLESQFNKWLLTKKVPPFYLQFLAGWNHTRPMKECPWWPKGNEADTLSRAVVKAMEAILSTSSELICDTLSGSRIAPSEAHFLQPSCPKGFLLALLPEDLAIAPPGFSYRCLPPLQNVDSGYLKKTLQEQAHLICAMYKAGKITVHDVVEVVRFLNPSSTLKCLGLPLLPLADGTLATLPANYPVFYCPPQQGKKPWHPFPPHHFLNPEAAVERTIYNSLQVRDLDGTTISKLIMARIPEQDTFSPSPDLELWLGKLWELLDATQIVIEDPALQRLPLIPTYNPVAPTRVSFQKLTSREVLFVNSLTKVPLDACVALGMKLIRTSTSGHTRKLSEAIRSREEQRLGSHRAIIAFFVDLPSFEIADRFQKLDHELHTEFSRWLRRELSGSYHSLSTAEKAIVQHLPLWETVRVDHTPTRLVPANTALMIPAGISLDVVQTWAKESMSYVHNDYLLSLMNTPVTPPSFYINHLSFPHVMDTITPTYKSLLREVLRSRDTWQSILVPNANGRMTSPRELYLSSNATFAGGFGSQNKTKFPHPGLRALEPQLCGWGLISTVTTSSFEACALAIHQDIEEGEVGMLARALTVFHTYDTEMPPKLLVDRGSQHSLRNLRFIPRRVDSTRYGSIEMDEYLSLPDIVSPSKILDPKFVSVAWTQRATCLEDPSEELRLVNTSIWEPTTSEVVRVLLPPLRHSLLTLHFQIQHLHVLSTRIAPGLPHNAELIEDLKAIYSWLTDHESQAEGMLGYSHKLFLNVDNPAAEWRWNSASELLFDERDSSNPRRVRQFLSSYSGLLRAAGVNKINHVSVPDGLMGNESHETQLTRIRGSFDEMREVGEFTDVILTSEDGTEFPAHRVFLAAQSRHFKTSFAPGWRESGEIDVQYSQECLGAVLGS